MTPLNQPKTAAGEDVPLRWSQLVSRESLGREAGSEKPPIVSVHGNEYRVLRILTNEFGWTSMTAQSVATGARVELLRCEDSREAERIGEDLQDRCRAIDRMSHLGVRRVYEVSLRSNSLSLVLEPKSSVTLQAWLAVVRPEPIACLEWLIQTAKALVDAHRGGLSGAELSPSTAAVCDDQPQIDLLIPWLVERLTTLRKELARLGEIPTRPQGPPAPSGIAKSEPIRPATKIPEVVRDRIGMANLVAFALKNPGFHEACKSWSARELARLKQWARLDHLEGNSSTHGLNTLRQSLEALRSKYRSSTQNIRENAETVDFSGSPHNDSADPTSADELCLDELLFEDSEPEDVLESESSVHEWGEEDPRSLQGKMVDHFRIQHALDIGGMGMVYLADDTRDEKQVAVKVVRRSSHRERDVHHRFVNEIEMLRGLQHPNIVRLLEDGQWQSLQYLALEYIPGCNLKEALGRELIDSESRALDICIEVAKGLAYCHGLGIAHLDIKPENILVSEPAWTRGAGGPGEGIAVKLADFGIARRCNEGEIPESDLPMSMVGTPLYMAPERYDPVHPVLAQSDIYSFGILMFELLAGRPPFLGRTPVVLAGKHCFETPPALRDFNPQVTPPVVQLIERCLRKTPHERFANGEQLLGALEKIRHPVTSSDETVVAQ